jgi:hypothetical protein
MPNRGGTFSITNLCSVPILANSTAHHTGDNYILSILQRRGLTTVNAWQARRRSGTELQILVRILYQLQSFLDQPTPTVQSSSDNIARPDWSRNVALTSTTWLPKVEASCPSLDFSCHVVDVNATCHGRDVDNGAIQYHKPLLSPKTSKQYSTLHWGSLHFKHSTEERFDNCECYSKQLEPQLELASWAVFQSWF